MSAQASPKRQRRRPVWRGFALFLAGLGVGFEGFEFGVFMPLAFAQGGFSGYFTVFGLRVDGVPNGLDVAGVFFPAALVLAVLTPLGLAGIAAIVVAALRQRVLPMAVVAAVWFFVAYLAVILSGGATDFLATQTMLLLLALAAAWPEVRALAPRA